MSQFHAGSFVSCQCGRRMRAASKRCKRCKRCNEKRRAPRVTPRVACCCCGEVKAKRAAEGNAACDDCRAFWATLPAYYSPDVDAVAGHGRDPAQHEAILAKYEARAAAGLPLFGEATA